MRDPRIEKLASNLLGYSVRLQAGENILIEVIGLEVPLAKELVRQTYRRGGKPFLSVKDPELQREVLMGAQEEQIKMMASYELARMKEMHAYIGIRAGENVSQLSDVPAEKLHIYNQHFVKPVHFDQRVPHTKWCILRYPNHSMAQLAGMSTEAFEDFYFDVCTLDYAKMSKAMDSLVALMGRTDRVRIVGEGTDLSFSIKGMPAIKCAGTHNIPDGEVYTAPVKDSVNGVITYNTPSEYEGYVYENIRLEFQDGKIVKATANDTVRVNKIFDTDGGARYIGEFSLGVNPYIMKPMKDILFDEKIAGSFHFTPGGSYEDCDNGNRSAIHWDLVCIQRPEFGGGEIWFDDVLIRKDGRFVLDELRQLNPENLK